MTSPARLRQLAASAPAAVAFYSAVMREWDLLRCEVAQGNLNGIILLPANCAAKPLPRQHQQQQQQQQQQTRRHGDPALTSGLLGFLLGADASSDSDQESGSGRGQAQQSHLQELIGDLIFRGYIMANSSASPWYGGCFEFKVVVPPGYPSGAVACPSVQFFQPLSHPELRNGTTLSVAAEIFASETRVEQPFILRELLDAVRELFVQPAPLFSPEVQRAAARDIKYHSATSSYGGLAKNFDGDLQAAERHFNVGNKAHGDDEDEEQDGFSPAQRYMKEEHNAVAQERRQSQIAAGAADHQNHHGGPATRPPPIMYSSDLGMIFGEAHLPSLVIRSEDQQHQQERRRSSTAIAATAKLAAEPAQQQDIAEVRARDETAWLAARPTFETYLTRRLTRQVLPSVAHS